MAGKFQRIGRAPNLFVCDDFAAAREVAQVLRGVEALEIDGHPCTMVEASETGVAYEVPCDTSPLLQDIRARIEKACGLKNAQKETFRFRRYGAGNYHPPHVDDYEMGGRRLIATAMLYLTSVQDGGETLFSGARPEAVAVRARAQRLALWFNLHPDGSVDQASSHESAAVTAGLKSTLGYFIYGKPGDIKRSPLLGKKR